MSDEAELRKRAEELFLKTWRTSREWPTFAQNMPDKMLAFAAEQVAAQRKRDAEICKAISKSLFDRPNPLAYMTADRCAEAIEKGLLK